MSKKDEDARLVRKSLEDNAHERNTYIRMALDALSASARASDKEVLDQTREIIRDTFRGEVGAKLAISIANGVRLEHINEYKDSIRQARANPPSQSSSSASASSSSAGPARLGKQAIIDAALKEEKWRLTPALRRAQRDDRSVTMEDVKKWRIENYNLEKRPRKFNSWVANRAFEEFQADLFFFDDLRQREKTPKGNVKESVDYVAGLLVVDTFSKKIAVVPIEGKNKEDLRAALEKAFRRMGGKPEMLYTDAEPGLTSNETQSWLMRQKNVAHNITLKHAPLAERMIGHIKNQIIHAIRGTDKRWWEVVDDVVRDYNNNHVSRSTQMTPNEAEKKENQNEVKEHLESIRKTDNPQPRIDQGDKVRVIFKKKFEKGYMPDWSDEVYTVETVSKGRDQAPMTHILSHQPIIDRQAMYLLRDPNNTLNKYKKRMFMRSELLLVQTAN